jgi:hypothetical protein
LAPRIPPDELQEAIEHEFVCERCGHCCTGEGAVRIGPAEADRMARHLGLPRRKFLKQYARQVAPEQWWLLDQANPDLWCIFLVRGEDGLFGCRVNAAKPNQCLSFPAKWRNPGSLKTCAGLRTLVSKLQERAESVKPKL